MKTVKSPTLDTCHFSSLLIFAPGLFPPPSLTDRAVLLPHASFLFRAHKTKALVFNGHRSLLLVLSESGNFKQDLKIQNHCYSPRVTYFLLPVTWCLLLNVFGKSFVLWSQEVCYSSITMLSNFSRIRNNLVFSTDFMKRPFGRAGPSDFW